MIVRFFIIFRNEGRNLLIVNKISWRDIEVSPPEKAVSGHQPLQNRRHSSL